MKMTVKNATFVHKAVSFLLKVKENLFLKVKNVQTLDSASDVAHRKLKMLAEKGQNLIIKLAE